MVQWADTTADKEKKKGGPNKPKKEAGAIMDIAQVIAPLAASVVGTPLAGAAVSALLEGAESKLEGGSWKESLMKGLISGGVGAATGGIASGADKIATEAAKKTIEEGVKDVGTEVAKDAAGSFLTQGTIQNAKDIAGKTVEGLVNNLATSFSPEASKQFTKNLADGAPIYNMLASDQPGDATAKQRFLEHVTELGNMGLQTRNAMRSEAAQRRGQNESIAVRAMNSRQGVMDGGRHRRQKPRYSGYHGG